MKRLKLAGKTKKVKYIGKVRKAFAKEASSLLERNSSVQARSRVALLRLEIDRLEYLQRIKSIVFATRWSKRRELGWWPTVTLFIELETGDRFSNQATPDPGDRTFDVNRREANALGRAMMCYESEFTRLAVEAGPDVWKYANAVEMELGVPKLDMRNKSMQDFKTFFDVTKGWEWYGVNTKNEFIVHVWRR